MNIYAAVVLLLLSFILIGLVIERYFVPSLENIAGWLKMPDDVAGATLLAFGSSAPELFTALMTVLFIRSRTAFGIGNIVGSALFQILVVIGFAALVKTAYLQW
jgi:Ca2+/Na+ antiporter